MDTLWKLLDRLTVLVTLAPFVWWGILKVRSLVKQREEDHVKISALWRLCGFNDWNGIERRGKMREERGRYE